MKTLLAMLVGISILLTPILLISQPSSETGEEENSSQMNPPTSENDSRGKGDRHYLGESRVPPEPPSSTNEQNLNENSIENSEDATEKNSEEIEQETVIIEGGKSSQDSNSDEKDEDGYVVEFLEDNLELELEFHTEMIGFNNRDFQPTDETSDDSIFDTDDATFVALEGVHLGLSFTVPQFYNLGFHTKFLQSGFWGNDQLAKSSEGSGGSVLNFSNLYIEADLIEKPNLLFNIKIGRQPFEIGGIETHDYMLRDTLDCIVLDFELLKKLNVRVLAFDLLGMGVDVSPYDYLRVHTHKENEDIGMRGDVNTFRMGAVVESDRKVLDMLNLKGYFFLAKFGALSQGGADRSINGQIANFGDDDYSVLGGIRGIFHLEQESKFSLAAYLDTALSYTNDLKAEGAHNVNGTGFAGNAGAQLGFGKDDFMKLHINFWYATGGKYLLDGYQVNHGFVSFKGSQIGGLIANQINGFHPSAYTDDDGIDDNPQRYNRKSGTTFLNLDFSVKPAPFVTVMASVWAFKDTNTSDVDFNNIFMVEWLSYEEIAAEERFGKMLGLEIDFGVIFHLRKLNMNQELDFFINAGIFFPGTYYDIIITELAGGPGPHADTGTAFGGDAPTTLIQAGTRILF